MSNSLSLSLLVASNASRYGFNSAKRRTLILFSPSPESPHVGLYLPISLPPPEHRQLELGLQKAEFPLKGILAFLGCRLSGPWDHWDRLLSGMMLLPI